ncbi:MAG: hypothetical protein R6V15_16565 [Desulfotignum sp.]
MADQKNNTPPACAACDSPVGGIYILIPTTVLAVKDRVTGHNPLAAVYQADSYYRKIRNP